MEEKKRKKLILSVAGGFFAIALVVIAAFIINLMNSATLEILIAPSMAKVSISGREFSAEGTHRLEPREVTATISAEGFKSKTVNFRLVKGETIKLYDYLMPEDGSMEWYLEHPEEMMIVTEIGDAKAGNTAHNYQTNYPISRALPIVVVEVDPVSYDWVEYRIDGGGFEGCDTEFCVKITDTTGGNYEVALQKIRNAGFRPEDYQVIYEYTPVEAL
ncbi:MAG: hypothetical protein Q4B65_01315 [Candidatus Saccharibacteria bacterium]|nr:hypothetical protein [Candidatus Saccharibacteria bacterium]